MKAVGLYKYLPIDHPESLLDIEVDAPAAAGRDLQVEVRAISVNPVDTKRRAPKDAGRKDAEDPRVRRLPAS
jgi:NADPH:quinone reductase-like Zn-dependent oxidoreductase